MQSLGGITMYQSIKENDLYNQFLKYSYKELKELFKKSKTKEEQDFYMTLSNIVLQREQEKVVGKQ
jgi:hypothetical protein